MRFLIAESEPPEARERRRDSVGRSSGETYFEMLEALVPGTRCTRVTPADRDADLPDADGLKGFDAVFLTGSPLHLYEDTPEVRRQLDFMRAVFASGTPSFGSCAGLQVATVAAGGTVRDIGRRREAGFARRIWPTEAGRDHPLLHGRPPAYDAPSIHGDEVEKLPEGAVLLASNPIVRVQAAEIRFDGGVFWGVQYHPEISLAETAAAMLRDCDTLVETGLVPDKATLRDRAALVEALDREPGRLDLQWLLGVNDEVADPARRVTEIRNFVDRLVRPTRSARGRD